MSTNAEIFCYYLAVDKAYKLLLDQEQKKRIVDVIHAGKEYVEHMVSISRHIRNLPILHASLNL